MKLALGKSQLLTPRIILLGLSFVAVLICAWAGAAHYRKAAWGDSWQPIGWILSMLFLLAAFLPGPYRLAAGFKSVTKPKALFFLFWIVFFVVSHLWNFRTAPWNGNALFDESGWDLWYLKTYVIGHPFQAAWFHFPISRETLFHYYVWGFLRLFGFNILAYQAALFCIWLTTFVFTILLVDLLFESYIVTSVAALIFNFLPFAFIYTFAVPGPRFFIPDTLPIPLPYYWLLVPGFVLALWQKRFEIVLLAIIPVAGAFIAKSIENRLLLPIPFWVILMSFTLAGLLKLQPWPGVQVVLGALAALILLDGLAPSVRYIYSKTKSPLSIRHYAQEEVAVSRYLRHVVAGQGQPAPPHLERNEFNKIEGVTEAPHETLICQGDAYSIIHLFLHDYDDARILSFCGGYPFFIVMTEQDVWNANKRAILNYVPGNKDLKLIWERDPKTQRIVTMFQSLRELGTEDSLSFSFLGRVRTFYVLNIPNKNIQQFQQGVSAFPATPLQAPGTQLPRLSSLTEGGTNMFEGGRGPGKGQFDSPTGIAVDGNRNILVADTNNGRIQKFSPNGSFITSIGTKGNGQGKLGEPNGIAIDHAGNIYIAEVSNHRVQKLAPDGTFIAEWKGPEPGFYGPRRIAIGPNDSVYVVDQGHSRIAKLSSDGEVLATWGSKGNANGQFNDPTSVAVDSTANKVYVADPINKRIQVFDANGKFLNKWSMPEWGKPVGFEGLAIDSQTDRLYASSAHMNAVLIFDLNGNRIGSLMPKSPDRLQGPAALALTNRKLYVLNMAGNRVSAIDL